MEQHDHHANPESSSGDAGEVGLDDVSVSRKKKDDESGVDVASVLIALGLGAALFWFFFLRG